MVDAGCIQALVDYLHDGWEIMRTDRGNVIARDENGSVHMVLERDDYDDLIAAYPPRPTGDYDDAA